ncbi:MAG: metallophosphoesterase family protein [Thermoanaerobaculia bacterium]
MRALIVSDIHSNAAALRAVLARVRRKRFDTIICLGDFVGYGAQPNQVLDAMRRLKRTKVFIRGNHDRVVSRNDDATEFNEAARAAVLWTRVHLSGANRRFIQDLPLGPVEYRSLMLCHGSPFDEDDYVFTIHHAAQVFANFGANVILYGHTHLPALYSVHATGRMGALVPKDETRIKLEPGFRYLINPGSVGQPRDRNPAASFAIYDSDPATVQFLRVDYDRAETQGAILDAGLPPVLAHRLSWGT